MEERLKFSLDLLKQHLATMTETEKNEMRE
jgi:hypothetical protein